MISIDELRDLYGAENHLVKAVPHGWQRRAENEQSSGSFCSHQMRNVRGGRARAISRFHGARNAPMLSLVCTTHKKVPGVDLWNREQ